MIVLDANLLIYAYDSSSPRHEPARAWLEETFSAPDLVCLPWATVLAFVRITTNHRILEQPFSTDEAVAIVDTWLEVPTVRLIEPGQRHWSILRDLLIRGQAKGPLIPDAHLAALALEHGADLYSADRDFARFEGLRWINPLEHPLANADVVHEP